MTTATLLFTDGLYGAVESENADLQTVLDAIEALGASASITVISVVTGSTVTVRRNDTWAFTMTLAGVSLTSYEAVAFVVKRSANQPDDDALLYVRSDDGLIRIGGTEPPGGSSGGSLTVDSATQFTGLVNMTLTAVTPGQYTWWLKCFDITPTPDEGYTLAEGVFVVENYGLRAVA